MLSIPGNTKVEKKLLPARGLQSRKEVYNHIHGAKSVSSFWLPPHCLSEPTCGFPNTGNTGCAHQPMLRLPANTAKPSGSRGNAQPRPAFCLPPPGQQALSRDCGHREGLREKLLSFPN